MGLYLMLHLGQSQNLPVGVRFPAVCLTDWCVVPDVIRLRPVWQDL